MVNGRISGLPALHMQIGRRGDDPTTLARHGGSGFAAARHGHSSWPKTA